MLTTIARKIRTAGDLVEYIAYRKLRHAGGRIEIYKSLNRSWLLNRRFATILDIGANRGQFASSASYLIPDAQIYCFEPIPSCFRQLEVRFAGLPNVKCFNYGLGTDSSELSFFENDFSPSSSFLATTSKQTDAFPHTQVVKSVRVSVKQLDDVASDLNIVTPLFVKIDVQGYELPVLLGGQKTIQQADVIQIETSFVELYEGQALFPEVYDLLTEWGFHYAGAMDQFADSSTGEILQADSIFLSYR